MPSKQIRILQDSLAENLSFILGKTVVLISTKSLQYTGIVVSTTSSGVTLKNSRNRKLTFLTGEIAELFTDVHIEA
ncbi:MAG: hypothetical protein LCH54_17510 [Bacteroidetes bacterium]|nr:hypothetical protein [Bacteroidota bacterium]